MNYAVADVETTMIADGEIPKTLFWGYADERGYKYFKTTAKFLAFLRYEKPRIILHHSNFDIIQLLVDGAPISIHKSHDTRIIRSYLYKHDLLNSYSCFPVPLKKTDYTPEGIFEAFGHQGTSLDNLDKRNYEDCVIGLDCFLKLDGIFYSICGIHPLEVGTIAGTGFRAAEKIAGKMPKDLRFVESFRGGRTDVFDLRYFGKSEREFLRFRKTWRKASMEVIQETDGGTTNLKLRNPLYPYEFPYNRVCVDVGKYDIRSSYPFSFIDAPQKDTLLNVGVWSQDWHGPLFDEYTDDMLLFPRGKFTTWTYADTLDRYISPNAEKFRVKIIDRAQIDLSWLKRCEPLVRSIYEKKSTSKGAIKLACKLLINATYGRIGLKGESERVRILNYKPDGDGLTAYRIGRRWICFDTIQRETRANYPLAAFITDNARGRLYEAIKKTSAAYCDTDSVFSPLKSAGKSLRVGNDIGEWENGGQNCFQSVNVKDYVFGDKEKLKGGKTYFKWSLKQYASGKPAEQIERSRQSGLMKRIVNKDGTTEPIYVEP